MRLKAASRNHIISCQTKTALDFNLEYMKALNPYNTASEHVHLLVKHLVPNYKTFTPIKQRYTFTVIT